MMRSINGPLLRKHGDYSWRDELSTALSYRANGQNFNMWNTFARNNSILLQCLFDYHRSLGRCSCGSEFGGLLWTYWVMCPSVWAVMEWWTIERWALSTEHWVHNKIIQLDGAWDILPGWVHRTCTTNFDTSWANTYCGNQILWIICYRK
jgi:hypothetical protein